MVFGLAAGTSAAAWAKGQKADSSQGGRGLLFHGPDGSPRPVDAVREMSSNELGALRDAMGSRVRQRAHELVRTAMDEAKSPF